MAITSGNLTISGFSQLDEILELSIEQKPNRHPKARFRAGIMEGADLEQIKANQQGNIVRITGRDNKTGNVVKLFTGYIEELMVHDMGADYYELEVKLLGASCKLDQDKKDRSFQDISMTHEDVVKKAASATAGTSITWNGTASSSIQMPVIEYCETDWEFILRMASIYRHSVIPDVTADYPNLSIGMELSDSGVKIDDRFYKVGVSKRFYELGGKRAGLIKSNFQYYEITSRKNAQMGQYVSFQGKNLVVCEKKTRLTESEIIYTYRLSSPDYGSAKTRYNGTFIGHTILGTVLETQGETLKLDLELADDEHNNGVAYPYNWTPETGNLMYCMPKAGTKVSLYFSDEEESSGTVVNCIRANGGSCAKMDNPSNKHFTSEDGLAMDIDLDDMNFSTAEDKDGNVFSRLFLDDLTGISFETKGNLTIQANEFIKVKAKYFFGGAANGEITLAGGLKAAGSSFYFHYQFDGLGAIASMAGTVFDSYPKIMDEPLAGELPKKEEKSSGWGLFGKVLAGLAAAAVATAAVCLICTGVGAGAGVVLGVAAAGMISGGFAVGSMAMEEAKSGQPKSLGQYIGNGFLQGLIGAASAAVGGGIASTGGKYALELATTTASTVIDNKINGKKWNDGLGLSLAISTVTFGLCDTKIFKNVPGLKHLSKGSDALDHASNQVDDLGRNVTRTATESATAKANKEAASEAAEAAVREEAEKATKEEAARRAERVAEQMRNSVRNNHNSTSAAKSAARDAFTNAKAARRAAVANHVAATEAKNVANQTARNAAETAATKAAAKTAAKKTAAKGGSSYFVKSLAYNLAKSEGGKKAQDAVTTVKEKYIPAAQDYIESLYNGSSIWGEE